MYLNSQENLKSSLMAFLNELARIQDNVLYLQVLKRVDEVEVICEEAGKQKISSIESIEFRNVSFISRSNCHGNKECIIDV